MVTYLCVTPERREKTQMIMNALARGFNNEAPHEIVVGEPPNDGNPFVVWGQGWLTMRIVPKARESQRPFWIVDNGFWNPARGLSTGNYRMTYRSPSPILLSTPDVRRAAGVHLVPWQTQGRDVLLGMPGADFGASCGINLDQWRSTIERRVRAMTGRPIRIRQRNETRPLLHDFKNVWAVVTHSSNIGVDAVIAGLPVFVEPTCPAAPVGRTDLNIENPVRPDRKHWLASLACQHFTLDDMRSGVARHWMRLIARQVDQSGAVKWPSSGSEGGQKQQVSRPSNAVRVW